MPQCRAAHHLDTLSHTQYSPTHPPLPTHLVDGHPVLVVHLVKLVDQAHTLQDGLGAGITYSKPSHKMRIRCVKSKASVAVHPANS